MDDFKQAAGGQAESGRIASRPELERLEAQRKTPCRDLVLTPGLGSSRAVEDAEAQRRAEQIADLRERLDQASGRASRDFALGQVRDRARKDFERGR